jgi:hypothetical protein
VIVKSDGVYLVYKDGKRVGQADSMAAARALETKPQTQVQDGGEYGSTKR